jgi:hypothetical protein
MSASVGTTTVLLTYDGTGYGTVYFPSSITLGTGGTTTDGGAAIIDTSQDLSVTWLKEMSGPSPTYAGLSSELEATAVVDGLTIVTQSYQNSPTTGRDFNVTLP